MSRMLSLNIINKLRNCPFNSLLSKFNNRYGLGALEYLLASNWFNPFATFYLNLRSFTFRQAVRFPVWVYGRPRLYSLNGSMRIEGKVKIGMIRFNCTNLGPSNMDLQSEIINRGLMIFHGNGMIRTGNRINVGKNAIFEIGSNFIIGDMCNFNCSKLIKIGCNTRIAHRSQLLDSNLHYIANMNERVVPSLQRPILIGRNCWISNTSTILAGAIVPDYTIVSSNSLVNKNFSTIEPYSIIGGIPAKFLRSGYTLINNKIIVNEINGFYASSEEVIYHIPESISITELGDF